MQKITLCFWGIIRLGHNNPSILASKLFFLPKWLRLLGLCKCLGDFFFSFDLELIPGLHICVCVWSSVMCYSRLCWALVSSHRQMLLSTPPACNSLCERWGFCLFICLFVFWLKACSDSTKFKFSWKPWSFSLYCASLQILMPIV